jgi:hypothetical protein
LKTRARALSEELEERASEMSEEERQRQMDFIVNTLAQISAKVDNLAQVVDGLAEVQTRSEQERRADVVRLARLEDSFVTLSLLSQRFVERLDEHQTRISDVENAIVILTRLVSERQNGKA